MINNYNQKDMADIRQLFKKLIEDKMSGQEACQIIASRFDLPLDDIIKICTKK